MQQAKPGHRLRSLGATIEPERRQRKLGAAAKPKRRQQNLVATAKPKRRQLNQGVTAKPEHRQLNHIEGAPWVLGNAKLVKASRRIPSVPMGPWPWVNLDAAAGDDS